MRLSAPKQATWLVALVVGIIGLFGFFGVVAPATPYSFWLMTTAWAILVVATLLDGI